MLLSPFGMRVDQHNQIGTQHVRLLQTSATKVPVEPKTPLFEALSTKNQQNSTVEKHNQLTLFNL